MAAVGEEVELPKIDARIAPWNSAVHTSPFDAEQGWRELVRWDNRLKTRRYAIAYREDVAAAEDRPEGVPQRVPDRVTALTATLMPPSAPIAEYKDEQASSTLFDDDDCIQCPPADSIRAEELEPHQLILMCCWWDVADEDRMPMHVRVHYSCERHGFRFPQTATRDNGTKLLQAIQQRTAEQLDNGLDEPIRQWLIELLNDAENMYLTERGEVMRAALTSNLPLSRKEHTAYLRKKKNDETTTAFGVMLMLYWTCPPARPYLPVVAALLF